MTEHSRTVWLEVVGHVTMCLGCNHHFHHVFYLIYFNSVFQGKGTVWRDLCIIKMNAESHEEDIHVILTRPFNVQ
jgi:hypothetical protein